MSTSRCEYDLRLWGGMIATGITSFEASRGDESVYTTHSAAGDESRTLGVSSVANSIQLGNTSRTLVSQSRHSHG